MLPLWLYNYYSGADMTDMTAYMDHKNGTEVLWHILRGNGL